jgi:hypothetical protein
MNEKSQLNDWGFCADKDLEKAGEPLVKFLYTHIVMLALSACASEVPKRLPLQQTCTNKAALRLTSAACATPTDWLCEVHRFRPGELDGIADRWECTPNGSCFSVRSYSNDTAKFVNSSPPEFFQTGGAYNRQEYVCHTLDGSIVQEGETLEDALTRLARACGHEASL